MIDDDEDDEYDGDRVWWLMCMIDINNDDDTMRYCSFWQTDRDTLDMCSKGARKN